MASKTILFLGADHFHAYNWQDGVLSDGQRFADGNEGKGQFAAFLQTIRNPVYLLIDLIEEDFRLETVPHLRGGERTELVNRKFEQYYRNTTFRQAIQQYRQKEGRRDDEVLFSALTNPALITPWLNEMLAQGTPIAGIYSVPNISTPLVKDIASNHLLLLSWEKNAGLRQTYFNAKRLHFSRLSPLNPGNSFGEVVAAEAARTQQYLNSLGLLPPGHPLDIAIICHANDKPELETLLRGGSNVRHSYLDIQEVGRHIKLKADFVDSDATPLFLHLLAAKPPSGHYGTAAHTHFFQLRQIRKSLFLLSAALATAGLLWSASSFLEGSGLNADSESLKEQAATLTRQTQQIHQGFPETVAPAADMKTAVLLSRKLDSYSPPAREILKDISTTLDTYPRIRINKISWQTSTATDVLPPDATASNTPAQIILLSGELENSANDYRDALNYVEHFQNALTQHGLHVTAVTLPLDISPKGSISANDSEKGAKPAQFSLKIIWRPAA